MLLDDLRHPHDELAWPRQELRGERLRQNANDRPRLAFHADRLVDDVQIAGVARLPEAMGDDNGSTPAANVFVRQEAAAHHRRHADGVEKALGDLRAEEDLRCSSTGVVHGIRNYRGHHREGARSLAPIEEVGRSHIVAIRWACGRPLPERDDALGVLVSKRPELQRIEKRDDRHRAANPKRQDHDRRHGERRRRQEHPHAVPDVVHEIRVGGELPAQPGGVGQRAERATEQVHAGPPVDVVIAIEGVPVIANFCLPLGTPLRARCGRNDDGKSTHERQT